MVLGCLLALGLLASSGVSLEASASFLQTPTTDIRVGVADIEDISAGYTLYRVDCWHCGCSWVIDSYHLCYGSACERAACLECDGYLTDIVRI